MALIESMKEFTEKQEQIKLEEITEIELVDGSTLPINTNLSFGVIKKAQAEGILSGDFHTRLMTALTSGSESDIFNMEDAYTCVYLSAKNAGFNKSRESFEDEWVFNMTQALAIYQQVMAKDIRKQHAKKRLSAQLRK